MTMSTVDVQYMTVTMTKTFSIFGIFQRKEHNFWHYLAIKVAVLEAENAKKGADFRHAYTQANDVQVKTDQTPWIVIKN